MSHAVSTPILPYHAILRILRGFAALGLFLGLTFVVDLFLLVSFPGVRDDMMQIRFRQDEWVELFWLATVALIVPGLIAIAVLVKRRWPHSLRAGVWLGVAIAGILTAGLLTVSSFETTLKATETYFVSPVIVLLAFVLVPPLSIAFAIRRLGRRSGWWIAGGYLALAPVFAYLATDDPVIRRPIAMEEIAPAFPGGEASYDVLMRYGHSHPLGQRWARENLGPRRIWLHFDPDMSVDPAKPEQFRRWLTTHRAEIEADWADLAPVHAWWMELAAFDRIADLGSTRIDDEVIAFQPVRAHYQLAVAIAGLQALDGNGDAAFATLQPILEVSRKLEPSSRTLIRTMIARVGQQNVLDAAKFVLETTQVSAAARARFATALAGGSGGEAGARRLIAVEQARLIAILQDDPGLFAGLTLRAPWQRKLLNLLGAMVYNPRRTLNAYGEIAAELEDMAARRDSGGMNKRQEDFFAGEGRPLFKNFLGSLLTQHRVPSYSKVVEGYWKTEDARAALLARLSAS